MPRRRGTDLALLAADTRALPGLGTEDRKAGFEKLLCATNELRAESDASVVDGGEEQMEVA